MKFKIYVSTGLTVAAVDCCFETETLDLAFVTLHLATCKNVIFLHCIFFKKMCHFLPLLFFLKQRLHLIDSNKICR